MPTVAGGASVVGGGTSVVGGGTSVVGGGTSVVGGGASVVGGGISVVGGGISVVGGASVVGTDVTVLVGAGTGVLVRVRVGLGVLVITVGTGEGVLVSVGMVVIVLVGGGCDVLVCVGKMISVLVPKINPSPGRRVLVNEIEEVRDAITEGVNKAVLVIVSVGLTVGELEGNIVSPGKTTENASTVRAWAVFTLAMARSAIPRDCKAADADEFVSASPILAAMHSKPMPRPPAATTQRSWTYWFRCVTGAAVVCLCT